MRITTWVGVAAAVLMLGNARPALAGPPLLCHPYDIGKAQSLPWQGHEWWPGRSGYNVANLVTDTMAILTPSTPVRPLETGAARRSTRRVIGCRRAAAGRAARPGAGASAAGPDPPLP
jgi:hypothetical protein